LCHMEYQPTQLWRNKYTNEIIKYRDRPEANESNKYENTVLIKHNKCSFPF